MVEGDLEHPLRGGLLAVVFNFVDKVLEVDGLEVDGVVEEDDVVAVAGQHHPGAVVDPRRVGRRQELQKGRGAGISLKINSII